MDPAKKAVKESRELFVPLRPIMAAGDDVELVSKVLTPEDRGKLAVC